MKQNKNKNGEWLDEVIRRAISSGQQQFDAEGWKQKFQEEFQVLESYAEAKVVAKCPLNIWRIIMKNKMIKVAAVVLITITILSIFEFAGSRDTDLASAALARTTEALKKVPWVHISCTAKRSDSDKETKSELWRNNELQISITSNDRGTVKFRDIGKNLKYEYNPKTNEIIVSKVTGKLSQFPVQLEEYLKVFESRSINLDFSHWEDVIDGNSVRVLKISYVDLNGVRREREFSVDAVSNLPLTSHSKTLDSDGLVVLEGRMVFEYPQEGPATIYDVGGVPRSAKVYGYSLEGAEKPDVERPDISESANKLKALGKALLIYANDHEDKYPDTLQHIEGYLDDLQWFTENTKYLGKGKMLTEPPFDTIAYDRTLLEKAVRTNVLHNDGQIVFERPK